MADDWEVMGSNPCTLHWIDVSNVRFGQIKKIVFTKEKICFVRIFNN